MGSDLQGAPGPIQTNQKHLAGICLGLDKCAMTTLKNNWFKCLQTRIILAAAPPQDMEEECIDCELRTQKCPIEFSMAIQLP